MNTDIGSRALQELTDETNGCWFHKEICQTFDVQVVGVLHLNSTICTMPDRWQNNQGPPHSIRGHTRSERRDANPSITNTGAEHTRDNTRPTQVRAFIWHV